MSHRPTRRSFSHGLGTTALACCLGAMRVQAAVLQDEPLMFQEAARGSFVSQGVHEQVTAANLGAIANVGFVVGQKRVAVIDTGGCLLWGQRLREAIDRMTGLPISHVIQTHMHPDHTFGAAAFAGDQTIIVGHAKLPGALAEHAPYYRKALIKELGDLGAASSLVAPTLLVADRMQIDLGGRVLDLRAHKTAHTNNDLSVFDSETATLWAGDLLFMQRLPVLDGSLLGWLDRIAELRRLDAARVVPGHGPVTAEWPAALDPQERYLRLLRDQIRDIIQRNGTIEEATLGVGLEERGRWLLFDDYNARNVTAAFTELEWE